jgi:hypothetical protein
MVCGRFIWPGHCWACTPMQIDVRPPSGGLSGREAADHSRGQHGSRRQAERSLHGASTIPQDGHAPVRKTLAAELDLMVAISVSIRLEGRQLRELGEVLRRRDVRRAPPGGCIASRGLRVAIASLRARLIRRKRRRRVGPSPSSIVKGRTATMLLHFRASGGECGAVRLTCVSARARCESFARRDAAGAPAPRRRSERRAAGHSPADSGAPHTPEGVVCRYAGGCGLARACRLERWLHQPLIPAS